MDFDGSDDWLITTTVSAITGSIDHAAFCVFDLDANPLFPFLMQGDGGILSEDEKSNS